MKRHSGWLWVWGIVSLVVAVAAFGAGTLVKSSWDVAAQHADSVPLVTAQAANRTISLSGDQLSGTVSRGDVLAVAPPATSTARAVVTQVSAKPGQHLAPGEVLASVSGRPVIALVLPFPLYRDLVADDKGPDVKAVQSSLRDLGAYSGAVDGVYNEAVAKAVAALYKELGISSPGGKGERLLMAEFLRVPAEGATVDNIASVGDDLGSEGQPLAMLRTGTTTVTARASVEQLKKIKVGDSVTVALPTAATTPTSGTVASIGPFQAGSAESDDLPGRDVVIKLGKSEFDDGAVVLVKATGDAGEVTGLAVPIVALRSDSAGTYVNRVAVHDPAESPVFERINVTVQQSAESYVIVDASTLAVGDDVVVSGVG